jgi:hypothetical protein
MSFDRRRAPLLWLFILEHRSLREALDALF